MSKHQFHSEDDEDPAPVHAHAQPHLGDWPETPGNTDINTSTWGLPQQEVKGLDNIYIFK